MKTRKKKTCRKRKPTKFMITSQKAITEAPSQTHLNQKIRKNRIHLDPCNLVFTKTKTIDKTFKNTQLQVPQFQTKKRTLV